MDPVGSAEPDLAAATDGLAASFLADRLAGDLALFPAIVEAGFADGRREAVDLDVDLAAPPPATALAVDRLAAVDLVSVRFADGASTDAVSADEDETFAVPEATFDEPVFLVEGDRDAAGLTGIFAESVFLEVVFDAARPVGFAFADLVALVRLADAALDAVGRRRDGVFFTDWSWSDAGSSDPSRLLSSFIYINSSHS